MRTSVACAVSAEVVAGAVNEHVHAAAAKSMRRVPRPRGQQAFLLFVQPLFRLLRM